MAIDSAIDQYVDGVILYRQYQEHLELSAVAARSHPDTLEAFGRMHDAVSQQTEFALAYVGVLKSRGANRQRAMEQVAEVEQEVAAGLWEEGVISGDDYSKEKVLLQDPDEIKDRAERFVRIFRGAYPKDVLPKSKRRKQKTQSPVRPTASKSDSQVTEATQQADKPEVEQDTAFHILIDNSDTIHVNRRPLQLTEGHDALLRVLLHEATEADPYPASASFITASHYWKRFEAANPQDANFGKQITGLQKILWDNGMANLIIVEGKGRHAAYQADILSLDFVEEVAQPTPRHQGHSARSAESASEKASRRRAEVLAETRDARFAQAVLDGIVSMENQDSGDTVAKKQVVRRLSDVLGIEQDSAAAVIDALKEAGHIFAAGSKDGYAQISATQPTEQARQMERLAKAEQARTNEAWTDADIEATEVVVDSLLELVHVQQGLRLKSLAKDPRLVELLGSEDIAKRFIRRLESTGIISLYKNSNFNTSSPHGRKIEALFVKLQSQAVKELWRDQRLEALAELKSRVQTPATI